LVTAGEAARSSGLEKVTVRLVEEAALTEENPGGRRSP